MLTYKMIRGLRQKGFQCKSLKPFFKISPNLINQIQLIYKFLCCLFHQIQIIQTPQNLSFSLSLVFSLLKAEKTIRRGTFSQDSQELISIVNHHYTLRKTSFLSPCPVKSDKMKNIDNVSVEGLSNIQ